MPCGIKPTDEIIKKIKEMTEKGFSRTDISRETGYGTRTIRKYQSELGYRPNSRKPYDRCEKQDGISRMSIRFHGYGTKLDYEIDIKAMTLELKSTGGKSIRFSISLLGHLEQELHEISEELSNIL